MTAIEPGLPLGYGPPPARAVLRSDPEDFRVTEIEKFHPSGDGTHAWLRIRKRGVNTEEVAAALARTAGTPRSAVGFAGMKDRLAVAVQWFSVDVAGRAEPRWEALESGTIEVLEVARHRRKLRRGALLGNRFEIVLRDVTVPGAGLDARLRAIGAGGVPNYFGPQRFGRDGANLRHARSLLVERRRIRDRYRRGLYTHFWRSTPHPALMVFDSPNGITTCTRRSRSVSPLQALTLLNDEAFFEFAQGLARRVLREGPDQDSERIAYTFRVCLSRLPGAEETIQLKRFLDHQRNDLAQHPREARTLFSLDSEDEDSQELAAWTLLSSVLLNLDEFITRE